MKLLSLKQVAAEASDVVFRNGGRRDAVVGGVAAVVGLAAGYFALFEQVRSFVISRWVSVPIGVVCLLVWHSFGGAWLASRRRDTNWLVRVRGNTVLIKFRSYQNWKLGADDLQVIELHKDEMQFVRKRDLRQIIPGMGKMTEEKQRIDLEIGLKSVDTTELERALAEEVRHPGWETSKGDDDGLPGRAKVLAYPVTVPKPGVIRIAWRNESSRVVPDIAKALGVLGKFARVTGAEAGMVDFTTAGLKKLGEAEQRKRLTELGRWDSIAATKAAQELYGCTLSEARGKIEAWIGEARLPLRNPNVLPVEEG